MANLYLFKSGEGFKLGYADYKQSSVTHTITNNSIYYKCTSTSNSYGVIPIKTAIDFSKYSKLYIEMEQTSAQSRYGYRIDVIINSTLPTSTTISGTQYLTYNIYNIFSRRVVEIDVSSINQSAYFVLQTIVATGYIYNIWLEEPNPYKNGGIGDFDGATDYPIGKLYDNNGTTSAQIGKVYDNDGTTSSLIYSAQTDLIVNGAVQSALGSLTLLKQQYASALTYSGDYVHLQNQNSGSVSRVDSSAQIEWSQYSTMKIELGASDCKYSTVLVNIAKNVTVPTWWWMESSPNATYTQKAWGWGNKTWSSGTILDFDVTDCTAKGILMIGIKDNIGDLYIKNIWLE